MLKCYWAGTALLDEPEVFEMWLEKVNAQRREKVLRCKNEKDKKRSLLAGMLLRMALEKEGFSYEDLAFSKSKEGKPFLVSQESFHFSLSHAGDTAVCLVSDEPVGIDMECLEKPVFRPGNETRFYSMAKKCLSEAEWNKFEQSAEKAGLFLEFWTKKEAYSKAVGKGLGMDFSKIDTLSKEDRFWSKWSGHGYCMSIYKEDGDYTGFVIEQVTAIAGV